MKKIVLVFFCICIFVKIGWGQMDSSLFPIEIHGKWGYMNNAGVVTIPPTFDTASFFSDNLGIVTVGKIIYFIDKTGKKKIELSCDDVKPFSEGMAAFQQKEEWGYVNKVGKTVIKPVFDNANSFSEGMASVLEEGKWSYINKDGRVVISKKFVDIESAPGNFSDGLVFDYTECCGTIQEGGFFDKRGQLKFSYKSGHDFKEGLAAVYINNKWGFIDTSGALKISSSFSSVKEGFSDGLCGVKINDKWAFINKIGKTIVAAEYDEVRSFQEGLAPVLKNGKWGFIDETGRLVIDNKFDKIGIDNLPIGFINGLCVVEDENQWGYIDKTGQYIWKSE